MVMMAVLIFVMCASTVIRVVLVDEVGRDLWFSFTRRLGRKKKRKRKKKKRLGGGVLHNKISGCLQTPVLSLFESSTLIETNSISASFIRLLYL